MSDVEGRTAAGMVAEAKGRVENLGPEQVAAEVEGGRARTEPTQQSGQARPAWSRWLGGR